MKKLIYMQYIGQTCMTIIRGEICQLISIQRIPFGVTNAIIEEHFPSRIRLAFTKKNGHTLAWCDRNQWIKVINKQ